MCRAHAHSESGSSPRAPRHVPQGLLERVGGPWCHCGRRDPRRGRWPGCPTLNTLIWQLAECRCSEYSPFSLCLNVSICTRKGTPFSPPCFLGVNSVLIQCTWGGRPGRWSGAGVGVVRPPGVLSLMEAPPRLHLPALPHSTSTPSGQQPPHFLPAGHALPPLSLDFRGPRDQLNACHCSKPLTSMVPPSLFTQGPLP